MVVNTPSDLVGLYSFPLEFPLTFSSGNNILSSLFDVLKPANTRVIFNYTL